MLYNVLCMAALKARTDIEVKDISAAAHAITKSYDLRN